MNLLILVKGEGPDEIVDFLETEIRNGGLRPMAGRTPSGDRCLDYEYAGSDDETIEAYVEGNLT
jgi:hypothetical protein